MPGLDEAGDPRWGEITEEFTRRLVALSSVSPAPGEIEPARQALDHLLQGGRKQVYSDAGLKALIGDTPNRAGPIGDLALNRHRGRPILGSYDAAGMAVCVALAAGGVVISAIGMRRRDIGR